MGTAALGLPPRQSTGFEPWHGSNVRDRRLHTIIARVATVEIAKRAATRPTWADVSLANLRHNYRTIRDYVGSRVTICAVVKAYAYGHGAVECSKALEQEGATWLGVTSLDEAIPLRE